MIKPILKWPDSSLRVKCEAVSVFDDGLLTEAKDLVDTMNSAGGIGIAANQIGLNKRIVAIKLQNESGEWLSDLILVNPEIVLSSGRQSLSEGCLSFPALTEIVPRALDVEVAFQHATGEAQTIKATGLQAVQLQHEIDHLDGVIFYDRMSRLKKKLFQSALEKAWWVERK